MKIKDLEFYILIFFMIQSCLGGFIIDDAIKLVNNDAWIIPIVGSVVGFPILKLYLYIINKNVNISNRIVNIIYIVLIIILMNTVFQSLISFISTSYLYDTPPLFIIVLITLTILYVLNHKTNSLFRTCLIFFYIFITIYFIVTFGLIRQVNFLNLLPISNFKIANFVMAIFHYVIYTTVPLLSIIYYKRDINNKKTITTYFLAHLSIFIIIFTLILVFGINLASLYEFPGYHILKRAFSGFFIERLEKILAVYWILSMLIPIMFWANIILNKLNIYITTLILLSNYFFLTSISYWNKTIFPIIMSLFIILSIIICIKKKLSN